jgi:hypothetical protein
MANEAPKSIAKFITRETGRVDYSKEEFNDDFLFRKTRSISITAKHLEQVSDDGYVLINIRHRGVYVYATKKEIKEHKSVLSFRDEVKYYYPCDKWTIRSGDTDWVSKLPSPSLERKP